MWVKLHRVLLSQSSFKPPQCPKGPESRRLRKVLQSPQRWQWSSKLLPFLTPVLTPFFIFSFSFFPSSSLLLLNPCFFFFFSFLLFLLYCSYCHPNKKNTNNGELLSLSFLRHSCSVKRQWQPRDLALFGLNSQRSFTWKTNAKTSKLLGKLL